MLSLTTRNPTCLSQHISSVITACTETERCFQRMLATTEGRLPQEKGIPDAIALSVLNSINMKTTFNDLDTHTLDISYIYIDQNNI